MILLPVGVGKCSRERDVRSRLEYCGVGQRDVSVRFGTEDPCLLYAIVICVPATGCYESLLEVVYKVAHLVWYPGASDPGTGLSCCG